MQTKKDIIVMKFGGTSVGDADRIKRVADRVIKAKNNGSDVVVVVSAMGDTTDDLIDLANSVAKNHNRREMDMLLSTGEQVSVALLALAIQEKGYDAISMTGIQAGIHTDDIYSNAKILFINGTRILKEIRNGNIVVIAGFQGLNSFGDITTLGRGGSDTTAVAIAAALKAKYCEIYTDVDGVYTTDPNVVADAQKIDTLSFEEMLELASSGAKVLHLRAVEFARKHDVIIQVRSSFNDNEGTWVMEDFKKNDKMERPLVTGVAYDPSQVKITVFGLQDKPGIASGLFGAFAQNNISVDLIVQNIGEKGIATISFTVRNEDLSIAQKILEGLKDTVSYSSLDIDADVAKVSIVGAGMQTHPGVAAKMFELFANEGINIQMISTSPIRISCVIKKEQVKSAVRILHAGFGLEKREVYKGD